VSNRNQLRLTTDDQAAEIAALGNSLAFAEIVLVHWPSPDTVTAYAWWNPLDDPLYTTPLTAWLDGIPLVVGFVAEDPDKLERFHEIPRTAEIGDDIVRMRFQNRGQVFEDLIARHSGGVKVEIFYFYPEVESGVAYQWFSGHLRTPDSVDKDFVSINAVEGLRSADLLVPNSPHSADCRFKARFGGRFLPVLPNNPCDYDKHDGGSRGNLDAEGNPFTSCDGTKQACLARLGDLESWGGFEAAADITRIGEGRRTTISETVGQTTRLKQPIQVPYGEGTALNLPLLDYAKEYNPKEKYQDKGTIRALVEIGEGPIEEADEFELMDQTLPREDGRGVEVRLGTQRQAPTTYSPNVGNYNRLAHARLDRHPLDPRGIAPEQIRARCHYKGRNTIRVYSDSSTYAEQYTNLRAWVTLDALIDTVYGHREDPARHSIDDFIYWAGKGSTFNTLMQGRSARQQFTDLCLSGMAFLPFNHNGVTRWLCLEEYDLTADDIPEFTDTGASRNILRWPQNHPKAGLPRLETSRKDDDKIPNSLTLTFLDAAHKDLERPLTFPDEEQQELAGQVYGDDSLREVPDQEAAYGITNIDEARRIGWYILDYGRFYSGGTKNNGEVTFVTSHLIHPEALDLHQNKVIKIVSDKLDNLKDRDGNVFTHFIVRSLTATPRGELIVTCQAYAALRKSNCPLVTWTNVTNATQNRLGNLEKTTDTLSGNGCVTNASGTGDAGGRSVEQITGDSDWEVAFSFDTSPEEGRGFGGLTTNAAFTNNYTQMRYCVHVSSANNTIDPHPPHSWFIYENGSFKTFEDGTYAPGDLWQIKGVSGTVKYYLNGVLKYTSLTAPTYPLYGAASLACLNKTIDNFGICQNEGVTGGEGETQVVAETAFVLIDRIWRDEELNAGAPGVYVAAAPIERTHTWPGYELHREIGSYAEIFDAEAEAVIGAAISVLAATEIGSETVDVELQPEQELPSSGFVWLGGELFNYGAATQLDTEPNEWRLSTLTNRGARCTEAAQATHMIGEDFALLDPLSVFFVPLASSEIGQTRNYKGITAGHALGDYSPLSFEFTAPNFAVTTPADYAVAFDAERNEVVHTWTPLTDACVSLVGLQYEIYVDSGGLPGALLWAGNASAWRETITASETRAYVFRAKTNSSAGDFIMGMVTVEYTPGGSMVSGMRWEILEDGLGNPVILELADGSREWAYVFTEAD
jgi:hypothetical protein